MKYLSNIIVEVPFPILLLHPACPANGHVYLIFRVGTTT